MALTEVFPPALGFHYLQAMEFDTGGATATIYGYANPTTLMLGQWQSFNAQLSM